MKQVELAKAVGVSGHTVWRWEDGHEMPNGRNLVHAAEALGVPSTWLLRGGSTPPGLSFDEEPPKRIAPDPVIVLEQQIELLNEVDASPDVRSAWTIHMHGRGQHQKITRVYLSTFIEVAAREIDAGATVEEAEEEAGTWAYNAAKEAHASLRPPPKRPRRK